MKTLKIKGKTGDNVMDVSEDPMSVSNNVILDKTSSIKFNFFSPLRNHIAFNYEWMSKPGFNWEAGLGIIGPGVVPNEKHAKGTYVRFGAKFLLGNSSDYAVEGVKYAHPLKGRYFKIEAVPGVFSTHYNRDTSRYYYYYNPNFPYNTVTTQTSGFINIKNNYHFFALNLIYGRQFIFGNSITVGYYVGFGYSIDNKTTNEIKNNYYYYSDYDFEVRRFSHLFMGEDFPVTLTGGFNLGYIFKTPEWLNRKNYRSKMPTRHSIRE